MLAILALAVVQAQAIAPDSGETHLRNIRPLTFGGQNAEAYFSRSGRQLIFQRQAADSGCDQMFVMNVDGGGLHRVSDGKGRTTCGYFFADSNVDVVCAFGTFCQENTATPTCVPTIADGAACTTEN